MGAIDVRALQTMEVKDRFRYCREARGWTQRELAHKLGVSHGTVAFWEKGGRNPSYKLLKKVAELYGLSATHLIDEDPTLDPRFIVPPREEGPMFEPVKEDDSIYNNRIDFAIYGNRVINHERLEGARSFSDAMEMYALFERFQRIPDEQKANAVKMLIGVLDATYPE